MIHAFAELPMSLQGLGAVFAMLLVQQSAQPRDSPRAHADTGLIAGRITEQGTGRPLPRALVTLLPVGSAPSMDVEADAQGQYEFLDVPPGEYAVWASAGEFRASHLRHALGESAPLTFLVGPARPTITLRAGEERRGVDIALTRALGIEGRVMDSHDEPMSDVEVMAVRADGRPSGGMGSVTDDRGEFRLFRLPPGRYRVCASPGGRYSEADQDLSRFVRTCHLASIAEADAADVVLDAHDATEINIRVQRTGTFSVSGISRSRCDGAGRSRSLALFSTARASRRLTHMSASTPSGGLVRADR
jgi:protocatechuate 3,4-dioxygenase beta subunit